ncbi:MAG: hypothetical protein AAB373_03945 [Patescibacteria group bacterium]
MKNVNAIHWQAHPMVIFWLGILTGAVAVALIFFNKNMSPSDYSSAVLKTKPAQVQVQKKAVEKIAKPAVQQAIQVKAVKATTAKKAKAEKALPMPTGNKSLPMPTGN